MAFSWRRAIIEMIKDMMTHMVKIFINGRRR